jgi:hypothetical protein
MHLVVATGESGHLVHVVFDDEVLGTKPKEGVGYRLGTSQVYTEDQARPMVGLKQRCLQEHADVLWIIRTHATENEAQSREITVPMS